MDKKQIQLGMNPSTANGRLIKDLLFKFAIEAGHVCFRCNNPLDRETFSVEHILPWLDSENPIELFFDTNNIAYSHLSCNIGAARKQPQRVNEHGTESKYRQGCKCEPCMEAERLRKRRSYTKEARRSKYLDKGY